MYYSFRRGKFSSHCNVVRDLRGLRSISGVNGVMRAAFLPKLGKWLGSFLEKRKTKWVSIINFNIKQRVIFWHAICFHCGGTSSNRRLVSKESLRPT